MFTQNTEYFSNVSTSGIHYPFLRHSKQMVAHPPNDTMQQCKEPVVNLCTCKMSPECHVYNAMQK